MEHVVLCSESIEPAYVFLYSMQGLFDLPCSYIDDSGGIAKY
jgi:hypothetical protein